MSTLPVVSCAMCGARFALLEQGITGTCPKCGQPHEVDGCCSLRPVASEEQQRTLAELRKRSAP
jgi:predicted RNA-binding Zn-ribbon protein involved in translation (DUF1610 family)